jgi:hypothetical protein
MNMRETIRDIIDRQDARRAGQFAMRWRMGVVTKFGRVTATHADIMGMVARAGREPADFEALLLEADAMDSKGSV